MRQGYVESSSTAIEKNVFKYVFSDFEIHRIISASKWRGHIVNVKSKSLARKAANQVLHH
jgi:hypothetical protein